MDTVHKQMNISIAKALGPESQLRQLMEECGELITAANKVIRVYKKTSTVFERVKVRRNLIEEAGDVIVMLNQIMHLLSITDAELSEIMEMKVDRTWQRVAAEKGWEPCGSDAKDAERN